MSEQVTSAEMKRARHLHAVLLFNLIVNHIFIFLVAVSVIKQSIIPSLLVPLFSVLMLGYILINAQRALTRETSWFVRCHWQLAARRARNFLLLFVVMGGFSALVYFGGHAMGMKTLATLALTFGVGLLPFMVTLLVLVVLEFDAEHQCKLGKVPPSAAAAYPAPQE
jgi:hypothetical protein